MSSPVVIEGSFYLAFGTTKVDTGAATNADSTPTVAILDNGSAMAYAPTVTNVTTGLYKVSIACTTANGFTAGHRYTVYATATVNSITGSDQIDEFEVLTNDLNSLPTAAANAAASLLRNKLVFGNDGTIKMYDASNNLLYSGFAYKDAAMTQLYDGTGSIAATSFLT